METENENLTAAAPPEIVAPSAAKTTAAAPPIEELLPPKSGILTRLARAIDRAISANPNRTGHAQVAAMILETTGGQNMIVTEKTLARLREWNKKYAINLDVVLNYTPQNARLMFAKQQEEIQAAIHSGKLDGVSAQPVEHWHLDYEQKLQAAKANMCQIYEECLPVCQGIAAGFIEVAEIKVSQRETYEREIHDFYGIPYGGPSNIVLAFKKAIAFARTRSTPVQNGSASPEIILPYINF
jgi:hypothetical protein